MPEEPARLIIDAHLDLGWNALQWNRNLLDPVAAIRQAEAGVPGPGRGMGTVSLPALAEGRVALCFATLLARSTGRPVPHLDYPSPAQAYAAAQGQLAYYRALEAQGMARIITSRAGLDRHLADWAVPVPELPSGMVISMEGADPILKPDDLPFWWAAGVRAIGPAHYGPGRYAGGTGTETGFTDLGFALLAEMAPLGIILDLTHLSDAAFWQALDRFPGPVIASHNNCRALVPHQRQFSDDQLRAIFMRGGVIGTALDAWMLTPGWTIGAASNPAVTLGQVVDHIDHICKLAGNARHAAIGSDLDGGFGREQSPHDLDTIADLQSLAGLLAARGYTSADIDAIFHGNWLRVLENSLPEGCMAKVVIPDRANPGS
jgi:membrane dipeptidase